MKLQNKKTNQHLFTAQSPLLVSTRVKILLTLLVGLVISILAGFLARQQYLDSLTNRTETISTMLDADRIKSLRNRDVNLKQSEAYIKRQLQQARGVNSDVRYLYVLATSKQGDVYHLVDAESPGSSNYAAPGSSYQAASENLESSFYVGNSFIEGPVQDERGTRLSVLSPVFDEEGTQLGIVGIDIHPHNYYSVLVFSVLIPVLGSLLVSAVFIATDTIRRRRQESVRMRSELVSIASHELRTPLTGIRWGEESLLQRDLMHESKEVLQSMYDSTLRLQESIEDILQLANWQAGRKQELVKMSTDIGSIFEGIFATQKLPAAQKNIRLEFASDWPKKLLIDCDTQRMKRVLNNLISNAIKYARPNTTVVVAHHIVDKKHVITITDHGIGIPKKEQDKVFAGFYRASNAISQEASGTGMGLYMSRNAIEQHGGKLWLKSEEGKGTTVYIQLP